MHEAPPPLQATDRSAAPRPARGARRRLAERLKARWFDEADHPYVHLERAVERLLAPEHVLLEVGCGRDAELLRRFEGRARELVGLDPADFGAAAQRPGVRLVRADLARTGLQDSSVDLMYSRAVMEHVEEPAAAFREIHRILAPGGHYVFLAPNLGDYTTWIAKLVPNRFHARIVRLTEGRDERDTFPAYFRCNSARALRRLCRTAELELASVQYLGQYPSYFLFDPLLFSVASAYEKLISRFHALRFLRGWLLVDVGKPSSSGTRRS